MKRTSFTILASALVFMLTARAQLPEEDSRAPHAVALALVLEHEGARISELEQDHGAWWFDTNERQWRVQRPVGPGVIDSTHWFVVRYSIAGEDVAYWNVNTRTRQIAREGESIQLN